MDPKGKGAIILAMMGKKPKGGGGGGPFGGGDDAEEGGEESGGVTACHDIIDAIKGDDAEGLNSALSAWFDLHDKDGGEEPEAE